MTRASMIQASLPRQVPVYQEDTKVRVWNPNLGGCLDVDETFPRPWIEEQSARSGQPGSFAQVFPVRVEALQFCFLSLTFYVSNKVCKICPSGWAVSPQRQHRFLKKARPSQGFWLLQIWRQPLTCARNPGFKHFS